MEDVDSGAIEIVFFAVGDSEEAFVRAALLSSVSDATEEGNAIFAKSLGLTRGIMLPKGSRMVPASGPDSLCGMDLADLKVRKGAHALVKSWVLRGGGETYEETKRIVHEIEARGHQAMVVADERHELGVIDVAVRCVGGNGESKYFQSRISC